MVKHMRMDMRCFEAFEPWFESTSAHLRPRPATLPPPPPPAHRSRKGAALLQALQRLRQRQMNQPFKTPQLPHNIQYPVGAKLASKQGTTLAQPMPQPMPRPTQILESVPQVH